MIPTVSSTDGISSMQTPRNNKGSGFVLLKGKRLNNFDFSSSSLLSFPCKWRECALKRQKLSLYVFFVVLLVSKATDCMIFRKNSGRTASLQPISISLSRAANIVKFVSLKNLHIVLDFSFVKKSITSVFFKIFFNFAMSPLLLTSFDCYNRMLSSWGQKCLNFPCSICFRMKMKAKLSLAAHFSFSRTRSSFSSITWAVRLLKTKLSTLYLPFWNSESIGKCLHDCNCSCNLLSSPALQDFASPPFLHLR